MRTGNGSVVRIALQSKDLHHRNVHLDAYTGRVLADAVVEEKDALLNFLERPHNELLGGEKGETVNGIGGGLLFLMTMTGVIIWWPGRKNWTRAVEVKWKARWPRLIFALHSAVGFWTFIFVVMWDSADSISHFLKRSLRFLGFSLPSQGRGNQNGFGVSTCLGLMLTSTKPTNFTQVLCVGRMDNLRYFSLVIRKFR
jgi:hypothetical protein